ncbi:MAG: hypothetical protein ACI92E_001716 [Oceanicoccus sp.]|jgi:hypothetical protein
MLEDHRFSHDIQVFHVDEGDKIYLFTNGVEESSNSSNEIFGETPLHILFDGSDDDLFDCIIDHLKEFTGSQEQDDGVTLVEICSIANESPISISGGPEDDIRFCRGILATALMLMI